MRHPHIRIAKGFGLLSIGILMGFLSTSALSDDSPVVTATTTPPVVTKTQGHHFQSDRFVLINDSNEAPLIFDINMSRKELPDGDYSHYYSLQSLRNDSVHDDYVRKVSKETEVRNQGFLTNYHSQTPVDLSARESFSFDLKMEDGTTAHIDIPTSTADFIVKNTPEYTKYYDIGTATITIGDETRTAHLLHGRIYSEDYREYIFFEGAQDLAIEALQFIGWDEDGGFYLFDKSTVATFTPEYTSHEWALTKTPQGYTNKFFNVDVQEEDNVYTVTMGDIDMTVYLDTEHDMQTIYDGMNAGYAIGTLTAGDNIHEEKTISGYLHTITPTTDI